MFDFYRQGEMSPDERPTNSFQLLNLSGSLEMLQQFEGENLRTIFKRLPFLGIHLFASVSHFQLLPLLTLSAGRESLTSLAPTRKS